MAKIDPNNALNKDHIDMRNKDVDPYLVYMTGVNTVHRFNSRNDLYKKKKPLIITAADTRIDSKKLLNEYNAGVRNTGGRIINLGCDFPKPILYLAGKLSGADAVCYISASHSNKDFNGVKYDLIELNKSKAEDTSVDKELAIEVYINFLLNKFKGIGNGEKVIIDSLCGSYSGISELAFASIGYEPISVHCYKDRKFSNLYSNSPDPHKHQNLEHISELCSLLNVFGASYDGDGDRLAIISENGNKLSEDEVTMLIAKSILESTENKNEPIVYEIKSSNAVADLIRGHGGIPIMQRTGSVNIRKKMFEVNARFAGELSGHNFYNDELIYPVVGGDDGLFTSILINDLVKKSGLNLEDMLGSLPKYVASNEHRITYEASKNKEIISNIIEKFSGGNYNLINIKGDIRVERRYSDDEKKGWGWFVVRSSNNDPKKLTLRWEGNSEKNYERIKMELIGSLSEDHQELKDKIEVLD